MRKMTSSRLLEREQEPLHRILRRAVEIDEAAERTLARTELASIAAGAGISPAAMAAAIDELAADEQAASAPHLRVEHAEVARDPVDPPRRARAPFSKRLRRVVTVLGAAAIGFISMLLQAGVDVRQSGVAVVFCTLLFILGVVPLALYNRCIGSQREFQLDNAGLWLAFAAGSFPLMRQGAWLGVWVFSFAVSAIAGSLLVRWPSLSGSSSEARPLTARV